MINRNCNVTESFKLFPEKFKTNYVSELDPRSASATRTWPVFLLLPQVTYWVQSSL